MIEGAARAAEHSGPFVVHRAPGSGDDAIVDLATSCLSRFLSPCALCVLTNSPNSLLAAPL